MANIAPIDLEAALDEGHREVLSMLPADLLDLTDIPASRVRIDGLFASMPEPELPSTIDISEQMVPGVGDDPDVRVKIYRPDGLPASSPALYWIHGGGMVLMSADGDDATCALTALEHNCLVVSVDYRLAPEHPQPALIHDCFAGLSWLASNADDLGIDAERIMVGGASAGGGLAAGLALYARDHGGPNIIGQLLVYPMVDHRNVTDSSHRIVDARTWSRDANIAAWEAYLGGEEPTIYSSPTLAEDLSGLPPAYINVGSFDMFLDEDVDFASRLNAAGTPCELHVYPGAFHGSNGFAAHLPLSQRWAVEQQAFIGRILNGEG